MPAFMESTLPFLPNELPDFNILEKIARQAGDLIMEYFELPIHIHTKQDQSPVTSADLAANALICASLSQHFPWPTLSEESTDPGYGTRKAWKTYWLIDPLDGTREFIRHSPEFTVNIALIDNNRPVLGVVYAPAVDELYIGGPDIGSWRWLNGKKEAFVPESPPVGINGIRLITGRTGPKPRLASLLELYPVADITQLGSSLKICRVAEGQSDCYIRFGRTSEWDTAAGQAVLEGVGGCLVNFSGIPLGYNTKSSLINPQFLACTTSPDQELIELLRHYNH